MAVLIQAAFGLGAMLALLALMLARARMQDARLWPVWRSALAGEAALARAHFECDVDARLSGVGRTLWLARVEYAAGQHAEAARVLRLMAGRALRLVRDLDAGLRHWRCLARVLAAIRPAAPPLMAGFRSWILKAHALAVRLADLCLVSSGERFRARVALLLRALRCLRGRFVRLARARRAPRPRVAHLLRQADDAHADLGALTQACTLTLEALAVSRQSQRPAPEAPHQASVAEERWRS